MTNLQLQEFKNAYRRYVGDVKDEPEWRVLTGSAIFRKHAGDIDGAIEAIAGVISLTRKDANLSKETATNLNYLADLYLHKNATQQAEKALRESIDIARPLFPGLVADDLLILAGIQSRQSEHCAALASAEEALRLYEQQGHSHGASQAKELIESVKTACSCPSSAPSAANTRS